MPRSAPRRIALLVLVALSGWASATRVVRAPHVDVVYDDPAMAAYAQQVAAAAETELVRVAALFGREPFPIRIRLQTDDDVFNAFALPLPRPHVTFRPLFPVGGEVGFHGSDLTELVLRHEITHLVQLTDTRVPAGTPSLPHLGLVGQGTAVLPPAWLLEGIATYVESTGGLGGRLDDARTRALVSTLAATGHMPSLTDVSLVTFKAWPGGRARYLLGSSFIAYLVERHGFDALVSALHHFQAGAYLVSFSDAWRAAVGTDLADEWARWTAAEADAARARDDLGVPAGLVPAADRLGAPAAAPDGRTLAWPSTGGVRLTEVADGGLRAGRSFDLDVAVEGLTWLDGHTLVLSAVTRSPGAYPSELFSLDVRTGALRRLTFGAHAHLPRADGGGCVLYVRDVVPQGASLRRWCRAGAGDVPVWSAPAGVHIVGLAVSPAGRVALSLYRPGGVQLALLGPDGPHDLTSDAASELDPAWQGDGTLWFSGDASGRFQLYRLTLPPDGATSAAPSAAAPYGPPATAALGGAEDAVVTAGGVLFRTLHGDGYVLARLDATASAGSQAPGAGAGAAVPAPIARPEASTPAPAYPDQAYSPWPSLLPYGWLPTAARVSLAPLGGGLEVSVLGLDDSARHALDLTVGYDSGLRGPLGGGYASLSYGWDLPNRVQAPGPPPLFGAGVRVGMWPHGAYLGPVDETAYGVRGVALLRLPVGPYAGSLGLSAAALGAPSWAGVRPEFAADAVLDGRHLDSYGAVAGGTRLALRGRWSYGAAGPSAGAWFEAGWWPQVVPAVGGRLGLSAGYRPLPPVPLALPEFAAVASLGGRLEVPVRARLGDGLAALERIDLEPTVRVWAGTAVGAPAASAGIGADLGVWADAVFDYEAALRFGVRGGYADDWWLSLGVGTAY